MGLLQHTIGRGKMHTIGRGKMFRRFIYVLIFMICASIVEAHHHRGHALYFLQRFDAAMDLALGKYERVKRENPHPLNPLDETQLEEIHQQILHMQDLAVEIDAALRDCDVDLKEVRRMVNQPSNLYLGNPHAQTFRMKLAMYQGGLMVTNQLLDDTGSLGDLQRSLAVAWQNTDLVLWHVNDAIKEEIYQDDIHFGHEPGFDPVERLSQASSRADLDEHTDERHWVICD